MAASPAVPLSERNARRYFLSSALIGLGVVGLAVAWLVLARGSNEPMPSVVSTKDRELARKSFEKQHGRRADRHDILIWLAEWYVSRNRLADAVACYAEIPTSNPRYGRMARYDQGRTLLALHRAVEAEQQARELIALEEASPSIKPELLINLRQGLRHILEVELRVEERHALLKGVIERNEADGFEVIAGCFQSHMPWNGSQAMQMIEEFYAVDRTDPNIRIAMGRYLTARGSLQEARRMLEDVVREHPGNLRAMAALITCLRESDAPDEVHRMMTALPRRSPQDPWLLLHQRGIQALEDGEGKAAADIYQQILQADRTSVQAWQGLARAAQLLGDEPRRTHALKMATGLGRILNRLAKGIERASDPNSYLDVADLCAEIGLDREGWILCEFARKLAPRSERVLASSKHFQSRLSAGKTDAAQEK